MNTIISATKGENGQWIITCEYGGWFKSKQYFGYTKAQSIEKAKSDKRFFH